MAMAALALSSSMVGLIFLLASLVERLFFYYMWVNLWVSFTGIAKQIAGFGYGVYAIDHPGFGLSDGLHGHIPSFDDLAENAIEQFTKMKGIQICTCYCFCVESCFLVLL